MKRSAIGAPDRGCVVAVDARTLSQIGKGVPRFVYETLSELAKNDSLKLILFSNRPLHPQNSIPLETVIDEGWRHVPGTAWMLARLNHLAIQAGADVLWAPAHVLPLRTRKLETVLTVHDLVHRVMPRSMSLWNRCVSRLLVDASIRRADSVIADSASTKRDIELYVGQLGEDVQVIQLGRNFTPTPPAKAVAQSSKTTMSDDGYLFALGSIEPRKNIDGLLDCFDAIQRQRPNLSMRLTGAHSWSSNDVLKRIEGNASCELLGFLTDEEIVEQLAGARAFIMPSHYEGFGLPLIEAVGLAPIIASDIPVFRELGDYISGIHFVDFSDAQCAADSIVSFLAGDPHASHFLPQTGARFSWPKVAQDYAAVFRRAARGEL